MGSRIRLAIPIAVAAVLLAGGRAFASGGPGVTGGGGTTTTTPGTTVPATGGGNPTDPTAPLGVPAPPSGSGGVHEPCVMLDSLLPSSEQSAATIMATTSVTVTLNVCGGGGAAALELKLQTINSSGTVIATGFSPALGVGSNPVTTTVTADNAAFGTSYSEVVSVINTKSGVQDASGSVPVSTPPSRQPGCMTLPYYSVVGVGQVYYGPPVPVIEIRYTSYNCSKSDNIDLQVEMQDQVTGLQDFNQMIVSNSIVPAGSSGPYAPTPTGWTLEMWPSTNSQVVTVNFYEHSTGTLLTTASQVVSH